jgi:2-methylisocitrate lyase-like PEP mutase family enzyme
VSVLVTPDAPPISGLAELGVSRISVGGAIAAASYGFAVEAVRQLQEKGTPNYWEQAGAARGAMKASFVKP